MAIKKTTSVKKSDPPKKKFSPNAMLAGKNFGKIGAEKNYYYMEGVKGGGQGGIRNQKDMPSLDKKRTVGQVEKQNEFNKSLTTPRKQLVTQSKAKAAPKKK
jgi:hypothetical protein